MKILLIVISMVLTLGGPAFAGSSRNFSYQGQSSGPIVINNSPIVISKRGGNIYNMTLNAGAATATMTIYDENALNNGSTAETPIYEIEVATAGDSRTVDFTTSPLQTFSGITASVTNGVGYLNLET